MKEDKKKEKFGVKRGRSDRVILSKKCIVCGEFKSIDSFCKRKAILGGYNNRCRECANSENSKSYYKHKEKTQLRRKKRYLENINNPKHIFCYLKYSAKRTKDRKSVV